MLQPHHVNSDVGVDSPSRSQRTDFDDETEILASEGKSVDESSLLGMYPQDYKLKAKEMHLQLTQKTYLRFY